MIKKVMTAAIVTIALVGSAFAQNSPKAVLQKVSSNLKSMKGATANFTYSTTDRNQHKLGTITGQIALKGNKYFIKQGENEIYSNGQKTWNFNGTDEVTVSAVDNSNGVLNPQKLLSGNFVQTDFKSKMISSDGSYYVIELQPVDARKNFKKVTVYVNKAKNLITKANVLEKGGNTVSFNMTNINTAATLADSKFVFDTKAHPGVEVIN
ncbi:MAG TPA: outer membrane lipoprotein carrier protein LolA [Arachidicoccus sp.]|nr:outer membrane lipoprotein carrier protein LolA [Arachidicoccus sp.]